MDEVGGFDESLRFVADCDYWMRAADRFRFHKVHEVLAVEREHAHTLRETETGVWSELEEVRGRYVQLLDGGIDLRHQRNRRRMQVLDRFYSLAVLLQSRLPRQSRRGPWARFLAADKTNFNVAETLRFLLPRHHDSSNRIMEPDRRWLEPQG